MSDLLAEVDEVMRQERMEKIWKENGALIIAFIVLTIVLTGVFSGYRAWDHNVKTEQTNTLIALQDAADYPDNILNADLDLRPNLQAMAWLDAAKRLMDQERSEDAYTLYTRTAEDEQVRDELRHLAILMQTRIVLNTDYEADADSGLLLAQLTPLFENSLYASHARIEAAVIEANFNQNYKAATTHLQVVLDAPETPRTLAARAASLGHLYSLKDVQSQNEKAPSQ